jgi:hypothetical protein
MLQSSSAAPAHNLDLWAIIFVAKIERIKPH